MNEYPYYYHYTELLARRDQGMLLIILLAICAAAILIDTRFFWPKYLPVVRKGLLWLYYGSLCLMLVLALLA